MHNILHITDLHLNHSKVSSKRLVANITNTLENVVSRTRVDTLVISGDVFDRPTHLDTDEGKEILYLINYIIELCHVKSISLIVLKGTGTHDGNQSDIFVKLNSSRVKPIDLVYCDKIGTWVDKHGYRWLGIPDEASPSSEQTKAEVKKLMKADNITKFDFATTHSYYNYHAGAEFNPLTAHDAKFYSSIVKYVIFNGHIHTSSYAYNILTGGSFDRNRHGEEEDKGGWLVTLDDDDNIKMAMILNKWAHNFKTYTITKSEAVDILKELDVYIKKEMTCEVNWLRIAHPAAINITDIVRKLKELYSSSIEITTKKIEDDDNEWVSGKLSRKLLLGGNIDFTPILPTTIMSLMEDKLNRNGVSDVDKHLKLFKELL